MSREELKREIKLLDKQADGMAEALRDAPTSGEALAAGRLLDEIEQRIKDLRQQLGIKN